MIIGNNKNTNIANQTFINNMNQIQNNQEIHNKPINQNINPMMLSNVLSKKEMHERSLQMLQSRLQNGLITVEEFNKKCEELRKQ